VPVELKTRGRSVFVLCPPGPQRREANLAAASFFSLTGDPSGLAIPDLIVLGSGFAKIDAGTRLKELWEAVEGGFSCRGIQRRDSGYYLSVQGPLALLASRSESLFEETMSFPIEAAQGFFLGGRTFEADYRKQDLDAAFDRAFSWRACSLAILDVEGDFEALLRLSWRERASVWRPKNREKRRNRD